MFTNLYPDHVPKAIPFVNDWRTNIELKLSVPYSFGYTVVTPAVEQSGLYIFNKTCLSGISFIVINHLVRRSYKGLTFSAKPAHHSEFPKSIMEFESKAVSLFPHFDQFLSFPLKSVAKRVDVVTLPALDVRPSVLNSQMCIYDQDWIPSQSANYELLLAQCFIHQYFSATLLPYSPPIRFISDGLSAYYTIISLPNQQESENRLLHLINNVLIDESRKESSRVLFRDYLEDYPQDKKATHKAAYLMHMLRSHFAKDSDFDKIIYEFMEKL